jgi:hypothetical protein
MTLHKFLTHEVPQGLLGATHRLTILYTDLSSTAATSLTTQILPVTASTTLPADTLIDVMLVNVVTAFVGTSISALTLKLGDGSDDDRFLTAALTDLLTATSRGVRLSTGNYCFTAADTVDGIFTATGANLTALTAGQVDIWLKIVLPSEVQDGPSA